MAGTTLLIADPVERGQHFAREPPGFAEDRLHQIARCRREARQIRVIAETDDMVEHELSVADGGGVAGHD